MRSLQLELEPGWAVDWLEGHHRYSCPDLEGREDDWDPSALEALQVRLGAETNVTLLVAQRI